jgi:hypothetical protein
MILVDRARELSETRGFMKVLVDAESQQILGASISRAANHESKALPVESLFTRSTPMTLAAMTRQ